MSRTKQFGAEGMGVGGSGAYSGTPYQDFTVGVGGQIDFICTSITLTDNFHVNIIEGAADIPATKSGQTVHITNGPLSEGTKIRIYA